MIHIFIIYILLNFFECRFSSIACFHIRHSTTPAAPGTVLVVPVVLEEFFGVVGVLYCARRPEFLVEEKSLGVSGNVSTFA